MAEVTTLLNGLYREGKVTKDDVYKMAELVCMSDEEIHNDTMSQLDSFMSTVLDKMFDDAEHGKQEAIDALAMLQDWMLKDMRNKDQKNGTNK